MKHHEAYSELLQRASIRSECRSALLDAAEDAARNAPAEPVLVKHVAEIPWYRRPAVANGAAAAVALVVLAGAVQVWRGIAPEQRVGHSQAEDLPAVETTEPAQTSEPEAATSTDDAAAWRGENLPLQPVTQEWIDRVYYSTEFPRILYADENQILFTAGIESLFLYDLHEERMLCEANIMASLTAAGVPLECLDVRYPLTMCAARGNGDVIPYCECRVQGEDEPRGYLVAWQEWENGVLVPREQGVLVPVDDTAALEMLPAGELGDRGWSQYETADGLAIIRGFSPVIGGVPQQFPEPGGLSCLYFTELVYEHAGEEQVCQPFPYEVHSAPDDPADYILHVPEDFLLLIIRNRSDLSPMEEERSDVIEYPYCLERLVDGQWTTTPYVPDRMIPTQIVWMGGAQSSENMLTVDSFQRPDGTYIDWAWLSERLEPGTYRLSTQTTGADGTGFGYSLEFFVKDE